MSSSLRGSKLLCPEWSRLLLDVLRSAHHVHAGFFFVAAAGSGDGV